MFLSLILTDVCDDCVTKMAYIVPTRPTGKTQGLDVLAGSKRKKFNEKIYGGKKIKQQADVLPIYNVATAGPVTVDGCRLAFGDFDDAAVGWGVVLES